MSNLQPAPRFTENEVSAIIRRAVELQSVRTAERGTEESGLADAQAGISLTQLQQAAAELGIASELIEVAAAEVARGNVARERPSFWGGPWRTDRERIIAGKVTEEDWPVVLDEIRHASGRVGNVSRVGKMFEWTSDSPDTLIVTLTPRGEESRIRVMARFGDWGTVFYMIPMITALVAGLGISASQHLPLLAGAGVTGGLLTGAFLGARTAFNRFCAVKREHAHKVMERLENLIMQKESAEAEVVAPVAAYGETVEPLQQELKNTL